MGDALKPQCRSDGFIAKVEFDLWVASTEEREGPAFDPQGFPAGRHRRHGHPGGYKPSPVQGPRPEPAVFSDAANHVLIDKSDPSQEQV